MVVSEDDDAALGDAVRESRAIDSHLEEFVLGWRRSKVKRLLAAHAYPRDMGERSIELVWEQSLSAGVA